MIQQFITLENLYEHILIDHHFFQRVDHFKQLTEMMLLLNSVWESAELGNDFS